jgi:hypothetical protein
MKTLTVGCIHWMKNSDRRLHPLDEKLWLSDGSTSMNFEKLDRPTDRRMCHLDELLKSLTSHVLHHLDETLH